MTSVETIFKLIKSGARPGRKKKQKILKDHQLYYRLAYFYPQYTPKQARNLPWNHLIGMIQEAEAVEAQRTFYLVRAIFSANIPKDKGKKMRGELLDDIEKKLRGSEAFNGRRGKRR